MSVALRLREAPKSGEAIDVGDCWLAVPRPDGGWSYRSDETHLSAMLVADRHLGKRPVIVALPGGGERGPAPIVHNVHGPTIRSLPEAPYWEAGPGWDVTGEAPNITVSPSIDVKGGWHGFIRAGRLDP